MNITKERKNFLFWFFLVMGVFCSCNTIEPADLLIINGKVITVDIDFTIAEAVAVRGDRIVAVGTNRQIKKLEGSRTEVIDAEGSTIVPGLIDAHLHPEQASLSEMEMEIPDVRSVDELLTWINEQVDERSDGEWIIFPKFFYTRLDELRPPTLRELDEAAPDHPVFLDGSYGGVVNSAAFKASGIPFNTEHSGIIKDKSGKPTGVISRSAFNLFRVPPAKKYSQEERMDAVTHMLKLYNRYGITGICSGSGGREAFDMYNILRSQGRLTTRVFVNFRNRPVAGVTPREWADQVSNLDYKTGDGDEWVKIGALKIDLDGGILTGTSYLRDPWGKRAGDIFGIDDPGYRGVINYTHDELFPLVDAAARNGWKFTAHCTGGGGVDLLLDIFEEVNRSVKIYGKRFSIIHGNFFTPEAIDRMNRLGIYADMQAAWFYKDADAMKEILGDQRIKTFLPYRSLLDGGVIVNGGSDHMVKLDADLSINPYNPFLAMWSMITRTTCRGTVVVPEEAISREEALKIYTINNAYASFEEALKGSVEPGKLADIAILSGDLLTCPVDQIKNIESEFTMVGGRVVYSSGKFFPAR